MSEILKNYVCQLPFRYLDIQSHGQYVCCPAWCPINIRENFDKSSASHPISNDENLMNNWNSTSIEKIRESVYDGSYRYCNHKICPSLSSLINTGKPTSVLLEKSAFIHVHNIKSVNDIKKFQGLPEEILFGFDRSCNLKCPSCRVDLVANDDIDSDEHNSKLILLRKIEESFAPSLKKIMITGSGDPFYSKIYRDYLINFNESLYPNLECIQIITNGILLNEKMWNSLQAKKYIKVVEISIDAGSKNTYENITRLNGDWDKLIENIKFLSKQSSIIHMTFSMVVSQHNYKEMTQMYNIINEIFNESTVGFDIQYRQLVHWQTGKYSIKDINDISVFEQDHPLFSDFIIELQKIANLEKINHNFHHLL
jgi:sulfatase maturation enzyme AslB (radical SAM superfamily)